MCCHSWDGNGTWSLLNSWHPVNSKRRGNLSAVLMSRRLITLSTAFKKGGSWYNLACHSIICGHAVTKLFQGKYWNSVNDCWSWISQNSWRTCHSKDFHRLVMKCIKVPLPSFFFLFICCSSFSFSILLLLHSGACTGPASTFSILLSIVQTIYFHLLSKISRFHFLHLFLPFSKSF